MFQEALPALARTPPMKLLPVALLLSAFASASPGAVLAINNFGAGTQGFAASLSGPTAEIFSFPFDNREFAFSFGTGAVPVEVTSLRFVVNIGDVFIDSIHAELSTGSPVAGPVSGVSLGNVAPGAASPITQTLTMLPATTITLAPATTYWVHLTVPSGGAIYSVLNNNVPVFEPGWSLGNSWYYDPDSGWAEITSGPQARIQLNVQPVPEPTAAGLGLALLAAVATRRQRRG